jgi:hypothetical protein
MHAANRWDLMDLYGCLTTASAAVMLPSTAVELRRHGVAWNLEYARCTKAKLMKKVDFQRVNAGVSGWGVEGIATVRGMLSTLLHDPEAFRAFCGSEGLDAACVLRVMRMWPIDRTTYTLSTHNRVKKWLL